MLALTLHERGMLCLTVRGIANQKKQSTRSDKILHSSCGGDVGTAYLGYLRNDVLRGSDVGFAGRTREVLVCLYVLEVKNAHPIYLVVSLNRKAVSKLGFLILF